MKKRLFLLLILFGMLFVPNVYAAEENLVCNIDETKGTCTAKLDTETHKATVVITLTDEHAKTTRVTLVGTEEDIEATGGETPVIAGNVYTYTLSDIVSGTVINANVTFKTYNYFDPECPTGHGTIDVVPKSPVPYKETVTIRTTPESCYEVDKVEVIGKSGTIIPTVKGEGGLYSFTMPGEEVSISVSYKPMNNCPTDDPKVTPTPTPIPKEGDVKVPDTDTYSYVTTFLTLMIISSVGFVLYKKVS